VRSGRTAGQLAARQAVRAGRARLLAVPSRGPQLMRGRHAARAGCARGWTRCCGSAGRARRMCCAPRASWRSPAARSGTSCRRRAARAAAGRRGPWRGPCCVPACSPDEAGSRAACPNEALCTAVQPLPRAALLVTHGAGFFAFAGAAHATCRAVRPCGASGDWRAPASAEATLH